MIAWEEDWRSIDAKIEGLRSATNSFLLAKTANVTDDFSSLKTFMEPLAHEVIAESIAFFNRYKEILPTELKIPFTAFEKKFSNSTSIAGQHTQVLHFLVFALCGLESLCIRVDQYLSSFNNMLRVKFERAILHLQSSIIADEEVRKRWLIVFARGETACEQLGASHFMLHGIWTFKANAKGGRTDLIACNRMIDLKPEEVSAGLILTEWKIQNDKRRVESVMEDGRLQASLYSRNQLAGLELQHHRYIIIVSKDWITMGPPATEGEVTYHFRNIVVDPSTPSKATSAS